MGKTCQSCGHHELDWVEGRSFCNTPESLHCGEWTTDSFSCSAWDGPKSKRNRKLTGATRNALLNGDWSDKTVAEIAEALDVSTAAIYSAMRKIKEETGNEIPHVRKTHITEQPKQETEEAVPHEPEPEGGQTMNDGLSPMQSAATEAKGNLCEKIGDRGCGDCPLDDLRREKNASCESLCITNPDDVLREVSSQGAKTETATEAAVKPPIAEATDEELVDRAKCLEAARANVTGHREQDYGNPEDNFDVIASYWQTYIKNRCVNNPDFADVTVGADDVANMMCLFKLARITTGTATADSYIDLAGYAACGCEIAAHIGGKNGI